VGLQDQVDQRATVVLKGMTAEQLADLRCAALYWPAGRADCPRIESLADARALACLNGPNRALVVDGIRYQGEAACTRCQNMLTCALNGATASFVLQA
jgi:hypothetical protein